VGMDSLLYFRGRLYVPEEESVRREIMSLYHDDSLAGHFGVARTMALIRRKFDWPKLQRDVEDHVGTCPTCQREVARRHRPYGNLQSLPIPRRPWSELSMDFITGLPQSIWREQPVDAILVIVDRFTKYCLYFPVSTTINAAELAELFHNEVELIHGPPDGIISDRGSVFTSEFWSELCYVSRVKRRLSTAFHPQTDGQTERANQVVEHYLRCFIEETQLNWPNLLRTAQYACNASVNATTGYSPIQALEGFQPEFHFRLEDKSMEGGVPEVKVRIQKLLDLREKLVKHWKQATERARIQFDKKHAPIQLNRGDLVALATKNLKLKKDEKRKLTLRFVGPFRVLDKVGSQAYRLALPEKYSRLHNVFHVTRLEPWKTREGSLIDGETLAMPDLEDDNEWEIESVKNKKTIAGELHYLVKWRGWPTEYNQWVADDDMGHAQDVISDYQKTLRKPKRKRAKEA
jgi:transposase InsO family protein